MVLPGLRPNQLRADNVAHAIGDKGRGRHEALLGVASDVGHSNGDGETSSAAEEAGDCVSDDRGGRVVRPLAPPDDGAASDDGEAARDEHGDAGVREAGAKAARGHDDDGAERAERELQQDGLQGGPSKGRDDEGAEAADGAVDGIRRGHDQGDEPDLGVGGGLPDLRRLEPRAAHARLAVAEALDGREALLGREEPRRHGGAGDREAQAPEEQGQRAGQQVDVLPRAQGAAGDVGEGVVQGAADEDEGAVAAVPPALAGRLLRLRVVAGDDAHEARGDDALDEAQREALDVESAPRGHGRGEHAYGPPENDNDSQHSAHVEPLQGVRHGVQPGEHAKVEEGRGPAEPPRVECRRRCGIVGDEEVQISGHAEKNRGAEYGLVVIYEPV